MRRGPSLFLHERAFADILERLSLVRRHFRSALLLGCLDRNWVERLREAADSVTAVAGTIDLGHSDHDLCVAVGTLDTVNDLPRELLKIRAALAPDSLLIGAVPGGDTLPVLRGAMRAADAVMGEATPHVHPRIEPAALGALLSSAGFAEPVVDVDRIDLSYPGLAALISDLRGMAATNILSQRSRRPLTRAAAAAAADYFQSAGKSGRTVERIELLHFAAWTPRTICG